ncbi:MAG: 39S ribosomal protein L45 [Rhodocyclaceae bacterium]|jgi:predicted lipid-binding transport protein (Tim44 family)|nr:Tim44 domain-containing protein [Rhodocyclaceae bacterium]MCL4680474.1 39S ribosomal protein L45 [Rhodocyclaceae bacterium]
MKNALIAVFAAVVGLGLAIGDAEAKRLGGSKSFGMQRSAPAQAPAKQSAPPAAAPAQPAAAGNRWLGPVAGLAAGLGLAALFSHLGLGEELASFVMILLLVAAAVFLFRLLTRKRLPQSQPLQYAGAGNAPAPMKFEAPAAGGSAASAATAGIPAGFDVDGFLRQAKLNFVRLQAAHDAGNVEDIRNFTTPEVFAEIRLQMNERGGAAQKTDVVTLNADLLEIAEEGGQHIASVRFHGAIRETGDAAPEAFDELWHLSKPIAGNRGWVIAGIQQVS